MIGLHNREGKISLLLSPQVILLFLIFFIYLAAIAYVLLVNPFKCDKLACLFPKEILFPSALVWMMFHSRLKEFRLRALSSVLFISATVVFSLAVYLAGHTNVTQALLLPLPVIVIYFALALAVWLADKRKRE